MYAKCIDHKAHSGTSCTIQKVHKNVYSLHTLYFQMCTKNVYFINEHKKYINVYKMYRSQSALRKLTYYTKSVQKCVLFVYALVPNVYYKMYTSWS